jgi:arylformamidase
MTRPVEFVEVSHTVENGRGAYPGLPEPRVEVLLDYDAAHYRNQAEFYIASLHLCGNTGTYVDAPVHRFRGAADLATLPLRSLAHLPVVRIDTGARVIGPEALGSLDVEGCAVLFHTGWSSRWQTEAYLHGHPHITAETAALLKERKAALVGIDSLNIDDTENYARPAHTTLLGAGIPICEHMTNLENVQRGFLHAVPIAWRGGASFPVRAYVIAAE